MLSNLHRAFLEACDWHPHCPIVRRTSMSPGLS